MHQKLHSKYILAVQLHRGVYGVIASQVVHRANNTFRKRKTVLGMLCCRTERQSNRPIKEMSTPRYETDWRNDWSSIVLLTQCSLETSAKGYLSTRLHPDPEHTFYS